MGAVINRLFTSCATEISVANQCRAALHSARFAQDCRMLAEFDQQLTKTLDEIKAQGLYKTERVITTPQDAHIAVAGGKRVLNFCANNYLGLADLGVKVSEASNAKVKLIATDGCFSMDGTIADLKSICDLADKHGALVMIDDAHATGFLGKTGRGTHQYRDVMGRIDIITGTLGKALGGASGGFTSARQHIVELLRQRSRPYLFSNSVAPHIVAATLKALELLTGSTELRDKLEANTKYFRKALTERGLTIKPGVHPIVPIMIC